MECVILFFTFQKFQSTFPPPQHVSWALVNLFTEARGACFQLFSLLKFSFLRFPAFPPSDWSWIIYSWYSIKYTVKYPVISSHEGIKLPLPHEISRGAGKEVMKSWQPFKDRDRGLSAFCWNGEKTSHQDSGEPYLVFTLTHFIPSNHHLTEFSHTST